MRKWLLVLCVAGGLFLGFWLYVGFSSDFCSGCITFQPHRHMSPERPASTCLKAIAAAQSDFRANDRDGNRVNDFWRADVAGLYAVALQRSPELDLLPKDIALADARPVTDLSKVGPRRPRSGYWFKAIRHADEEVVNAASRFAVCAFPADLTTDKYTFIVDENFTIFRTAVPHPQGIDVFPTEEQLKAEWNKLD